MFMGQWMWENEWRHDWCYLLPNVSRCCPFSKLHAFTLQPGRSPNNAHDLMVNFVHFHFPGRSGRASNFKPSTKLMCQHIHCQKNAPQTWCNATAEPSRRKMRDFIQATGPSFTSFYDGGALMACKRHSPQVGATLMRKRQTSSGGSVEIGAPVFITLVYRLNSHLPPLPSVLNVPLICFPCARTWNNCLKMNERNNNTVGCELREGKKELRSEGGHLNSSEC